MVLNNRPACHTRLLHFASAVSPSSIFQKNMQKSDNEDAHMQHNKKMCEDDQYRNVFARNNELQWNRAEVLGVTGPPPSPALLYTYVYISEIQAWRIEKHEKVAVLFYWGGGGGGGGEDVATSSPLPTPDPLPSFWIHPWTGLASTLGPLGKPDSPDLSYA